MKSKSPRFLNASRLFYIHLTVFISGVLLYWYAFVQEITYPGNATVPVEVWQQNSVTRINFSLMWALIILIHFGIVSALNWRKNRQIAEAESYIRQNDTSDDAIDRLQMQDDHAEDMVDYRGEHREQSYQH